MRATEIIENLRDKLSRPVGRHLYGVLGDYSGLVTFERALSEARTPEGGRFPGALNVNRGILDTIPDEEFRALVENEAKRPEPTAAHVSRAFETFLRRSLQAYRDEEKGILVLTHLELLFAYNLELNLLRTLATDDDRILLLLPGKRAGGTAVMFPGLTDGSYILPINFIADDHLWEMTN